MAFLLTFSGGGSATYKDAVRACKDAQLALAGATPLIVDGVTLADRERVLLRGQTAPEENGIYVVEISGGNYVLTRATDANNSNDVLPNMLVPVSAGTLNADKIFQLVSPSAEPIAVDVDPLVFTDVLIGLANKADRDLANLLPTAINQSLLFGDDTSYNIGAAGASRPQTLYVKTAINLNSLTASTFVGSSGGKDLVSLSSATATSYLDNFGGDLGAGGTKGLVPAPAIGDATRYLKGDGTWATITLLPPYSQDKVLYSTASAAEWRTVGTGSTDSSYPTNTVILGRTKPTSLSGTENTIIGSLAATNATTAQWNTIIGYNAAPTLTTGIRNVIIGDQISTGTNPTFCTIVGSSIGLSGSPSQAVFIGNGANGGTLSVIIGSGANGGDQTVVVGQASGSGNYGVVIGRAAVTYTDYGIAIGYGAKASAGSYAVTLGALSGSGYSGTVNTIIGGNSAKALTTGTNNTLVGQGVAATLTSGSSNTVVGAGAFNSASLTTAANNTILGAESATALTTGTGNTVIGKGAGTALTTTTNCTVIGTECAQQLQTGIDSVVIGWGASANNTYTQDNVVIGNRAGQGAYTICNTFIGSYAGNSGSGSSSVMIGQAAGWNMVGGGDNCLFLGRQSGFQQNGNDNIYFGYRAGEFNVASQSIALGHYSSPGSLANIFALGSNSVPINTLYLGKGGATQTTANAVKIQTQRASGSDTDLSAGTLTLAGSQSTGNKAGGDVILSTAPAGSSGSTLNTHVERIRIKAATEVVVNDTGVDFDFRVEGLTDANLLYVDAGNDRVGVGTNVPDTKLHVKQESAATNTVTNVLRVDSQSSGTPASGIGVGIEMAAETAAGNTEVGVVLEAVTTDVTSTSEDFDFVVKNMAAGATAAETLRVTSTGNTKVSNGDLILNTAGNGLKIKTGPDATAGVVTGLSSVSSTTINTAKALTGSLIFVQPINTSDKHGFAVSTITNGVSFTVDFSGNYTGDLAWFIINPA